jgi:hypothetical protein
MKISIKKIITLLTLCLTVYMGNAQEKASFDIGVDFASRYVWRGLEFSDSPAIQPYVEFISGNLTLGAWASYETGGQVVGQELDLYASYEIGNFAIGFTDYAFPVDIVSDGYFEIKNHIGEALLSFNGSEGLPISLMVGVNVYNDDKNSIYAELGVPFKIGATEVSAFLGAGNEIYTTDGDFTVTNFGLSASKELKVTDKLSLGLTASTIFNPDTDDAYLVFLFSI